MRVLLVFAHPFNESFGAALRDTAHSSLLAAGHDVDLLDLYAEGFDALIEAVDEDGPSPSRRRKVFAAHARRLSEARALVLVYPTWWGTQPALLKAWFDMVWVEGVAWPSRRRTAFWRRPLANIRHLITVTTYGSSRSINAVQGEPGRRLIMRGIKPLLHPLVRTRWMGLRKIDRSSHRQRDVFLHHVDEQLRTL